jgi:proteic killer suppression protein
MDVLSRATKLEDVNLPGYKLHSLNTKPVRHSIWVSEQWRMTFEWRQDGVRAVDLEQYH